MKFTDPLVIDLNDKTLFPDSFVSQSKPNPRIRTSRELKFTTKTREEILNEVAKRARAVLGLKK